MTKTVLITGASSGIGLACAEIFAQNNYQVLALARREDRLRSLAERQPKVRCYRLDIRDSKSEVWDQIPFQDVDIVINNAGLALGTNSIQTSSEADWTQMFETNVMGLIRVTQKVLGFMIEKQKGDIVNVGSIAAFQTYPGGSIYNATKFAVRALTEAWRKDLLGKNIRVIGIHPGMVETEFSEVRFSGDKLKAKSVYQGMRALQSEDIAQSIYWAISAPAHVCIESLVIMPTDQAAAGMVYRRES